MLSRAQVTDEASRREPVVRLADALAEVNRDRRFEGLRHLGEAMAEHDLRAALALGERIPDNNDKVEFLRAVFAKWAEREPAQALAQSMSYPAGLLRSETLEGALGTLGRARTSRGGGLARFQCLGTAEGRVVGDGSDGMGGERFRSGRRMVRGDRFHFAKRSERPRHGMGGPRPEQRRAMGGVAARSR
jgi:hypothetical protein